jgi:hypothetical protein
MCLAPSRALTATDSDAGRITHAQHARRLPLFTSSALPASPFAGYGSTSSPTHNSCMSYAMEATSRGFPGFPHLPGLRPAPGRPRQHARRCRVCRDLRRVAVLPRAATSVARAGLRRFPNAPWPPGAVPQSAGAQALSLPPQQPLACPTAHRPATLRNDGYRRCPAKAPKGFCGSGATRSPICPKCG